MKRYIKVFAFLLIALMCILAFAACGAKNNGMMDEAPEGAIGEGSESEKGNIVDGDVNRKIVYNVSMYIKVDEVAEVKNVISDKNSALGGYVEHNHENYEDGKCSYVSITYRVPTEKLDEFINAIEGQGGVESKSVSTEDITTEYVNADAQRLALEEKKQQLLEILEESAMSAGERIQMVNEISYVNSQLQSIELMLSQYDSKVDYSTVSIRISEKASLWEIIAPTVIFFVFLWVCATVITVILVIRHRRKKRSAAKTTV